MVFSPTVGNECVPKAMNGPATGHAPASREIGPPHFNAMARTLLQSSRLGPPGLVVKRETGMANWERGLLARGYGLTTAEIHHHLPVPIGRKAPPTVTSTFLRMTTREQSSRLTIVEYSLPIGDDNGSRTCEGHGR
jgi:hypothetical protein